MVFERIELAPPSQKSGIVTNPLYSQRSILPSTGDYFSRRARHTATHMHSNTTEEKEVVMADDEPQPPIKQPATAVHHRPATRPWCGPVLLVLLGGVVALLVFFACCLMSRFLGCTSGKRHKTSEI